MRRTKQAAPTIGRLEPVGLPTLPERSHGPSGQPAAAAVAMRLAAMVENDNGDLIYLASSERRAEETARALAGVVSDAEILYLPAWDCLPFDRATPSAEIMGRRMSTLRRCCSIKRRKILIASPEAAVQKLPPAEAVREAFTLKVGAALDREAFEHFARRTGYIVDDRIDEPGEIAFRGNVVEIFPADREEPIRIVDADGVIETLLRYDPRSQRSIVELTDVDIGPASEVIADADTRTIGDEHRLAQRYEDLATIFDYLPGARLIWADPAPDRVARAQELIAEAHATARDLGDRKPSPVTELYLDAGTWAKALKGVEIAALDVTDLDPVPDFSSDRFPARALAAFIRQHRDTTAVVLCGTRDERKRLSAMLHRHDIQPVELNEAMPALEGRAGVWFANLDLDAGFIDMRAGIVAVAAADVLGSRLSETHRDAPTFLAPTELRVGDVVVHEDYGVGILRDLTRIETNGVEQDTIKLEYHGGTAVMVPVGDFGKLWRYGAEADAVSLDRLNTDAWAKKRASVSREISEAADGMARLARQRLETVAPVLKPPKAGADRLAARFPYPETPDQTAAIAAVLDDLASGRPMNRLICGDVGFGKTEVALRAAAAVALCGKQVAVVAPTTVLARQHLQSFERRFAGTDISVGALSRLSTAAENAGTKERLRSGELRIVVATHAIAAEDVAFRDLGLVVIDEEQRFGAKLKRQVEALAADAHLLAMSATPIPRSLQAAMVGLQEISVLATPPSRRRPIRTFLTPFDLPTARTALLREKRRGGQSFFVVPRIDDIEAVRGKLQRIVPDLQVVVAHGDLPAREIDTALTTFADGNGDILLATNIIESGLDVPRANTMLIWRADRFGLSQLHQLRGRVGRGRTQGIAYLLTDPGVDVADATRSRLSTLEAFDRLGSGFDISARDLELRGAGELLGEDQTGHLHLIGSGLYQQLLERALAEAKGETTGATLPAELNIGIAGNIPIDYVPEAVVRINLYARLQRLQHANDLEAFAEEIADRFGALPTEVSTLLSAARIALEAGALGIHRIDAGPRGIALTLARDIEIAAVTSRLSGALKSSDGRLIYERRGEDTQVLAELERLLGISEPAGR